MHSTHLVRTCYRVVPVDIACLLVLRGALLLLPLLLHVCNLSYEEETISTLSWFYSALVQFIRFLCDPAFLPSCSCRNIFLYFFPAGSVVNDSSRVCIADIYCRFFFVDLLRLRIVQAAVVLFFFLEVSYLLSYVYLK